VDNDRPEFDAYFSILAQTIALRGDCARRKVGALIVWDNRIWATGYNGTPEQKQAGCLEGACPRGQLSNEECAPYSNYGNCISIHAEINALNQFNIIRHVVKWELGKPNIGLPLMYISDVPCLDCQIELTQADVQFVWPIWKEKA
jgi:dCMP deaminase